MKKSKMRSKKEIKAHIKYLKELYKEISEDPMHLPTLNELSDIQAEISILKWVIKPSKAIKYI